MTPRQDRPGRAAERRFHLAPTKGLSGTEMRLADGDAEHARRVLRLAPGDRCIGLDGEGGSWPLLVTRVEKREVWVEPAGEVVREPAPGEAGASLPWIEVAVAMPKGGPAEAMVDSLAQLGAAAVIPLVCERSPPGGRSEGVGKRARWQRIALESSKQCGRSWNLQIVEPHDFEGLEARKTGLWLHCDPRAEVHGPGARAGPGGLADLNVRAFTRTHPLVLLIGPEGGFSPDEEDRLDAHGARTLRLGPHILRTETAAVAALAVLVARLQHRT